jgi:hypothetical protein
VTENVQGEHIMAFHVKPQTSPITRPTPSAERLTSTVSSPETSNVSTTPETESQTPAPGAGVIQARQKPPDSLFTRRNLGGEVNKLKTYNSPSHPLVVAAIPCYNTAKNIADVVTKTLKYVDQVVVVDDGSKDKTAAVAGSAGARVIRHKKNQGKGAAMKTAIASIEADIIVFIDGDGQHNPGDIPHLLAPILEGKADFVIGSRYLSESLRSSNPFMRRFFNAIASWVITIVISVLQPIAGFVTRQPLTKRKKPGVDDLPMSKTGYRVLNRKFKWVSDCTSGLTAMRKENCSQLDLISNRFQIETEMIFEQSKNGFVIAEIPISCRWEGSSSSLSVMKDSLKTLALLCLKLTTYSRVKKPSSEVKL